MLMMLIATLDSESDKALFSVLFTRYRPLMEQTAMRLLGEQKDAEDAVQNAFLQVIRHFATLRGIPQEEVPYWLISIVKNEALMIRRKRSRLVPLEDMESFERSAQDVTSYRELVECFSRLPETYRAVLEMKLLLGYTDAEIAKKLGLTETAVSTRASRGRSLLRTIVEKEGFAYDG